MVETTISRLKLDGHLVLPLTFNRAAFDFLFAFPAEKSPLVAARNYPQAPVLNRRIVHRRPTTHEVIWDEVFPRV